MLNQIKRNFHKLRVPQGYSGDLRLHKVRFERFTQGESIAEIGGKSLFASGDGIVWKKLKQDSLTVEEGTEIYEVVNFPRWLRIIPLNAAISFLALFVAYLTYMNQRKFNKEQLQNTKIEIGLKDPQFSVQKIKETLIQPKPEPKVKGPLIENPQLTRWWLERLEEPIERGVDVVYGPKGIGKSTFMERLCHVLSNPGMLKKYSDTKTQFVSVYLEIKKQQKGVWSTFYRGLGVKGDSTNDEVLLQKSLRELIDQGKKPILILDNLQNILPRIDDDSEGANFIKDLILTFTARGLAKVILLSSDQHLPDRVGSLSTIDKGSDVDAFQFSYQEGEEVTNWMKQVAEMYSRSVADEDLQLYLKYHGSLRDFKDFCSNYKEISLREYLKATIEDLLVSLRIQSNRLQVDKPELKKLFKPLFEGSVIEFPLKMEDFFLWLLEDNFIRRNKKFHFAFNSRISESAMRVYLEEHGDSEFLKGIINQLK